MNDIKFQAIEVCDDCGHWVLFKSTDYASKNCFHCNSRIKSPNEPEIDKYDSYNYFD